MKIMISPAKKMNIDTDTLAVRDLPVYLKKTETILSYLQSLSFEEAKKLWGCSEKLARANYEGIQQADLRKNLTPAILSYEGIQYQYMAPVVFETEAFSYVQRHLRILSGFYGILKPFDGVIPYRLEMQAKAGIDNKKDLYEFWGDDLYQQMMDTDRIIINLASREYSKGIERYLKPEDHMITCVFGEWKDGKVIQKGTLAKMARGEMVRYMAEHQMEDPKQMRQFHRLGYQYEEKLSSEKEFIFLKRSLEDQKEKTYSSQ